MASPVRPPRSSIFLKIMPAFLLILFTLLFFRRSTSNVYPDDSVMCHHKPSLTATVFVTGSRCFTGRSVSYYSNYSCCASFQPKLTQFGDVEINPDPPLQTNSKIFSGNTDQNTEVTQMFKSAIDAQFIRISPVSWYRNPALRIEILGPCQDNEVPNLICPHDTSETTDPGKSNSSATWNDPTVTDNVDSNLTVTCSSASGSSFDAGSTIVNCSATDNAGNTDSCTFNVTIKDIEVPKVICPDDINQATDQGQSTSSATWNDPEVTDNVDSSLSVTCSPISGLSFSVGSTPVICSAKDTAGNTGSCTFNVTVKDEEIPNVICPFDISKFIIEGQSTSTATWREPMVIDNFDFSLSANCSHASGASFSVGSTTVNCSVEDSAGNTGSCTFNVEVIDIDIPSVTCPDDISQTTIQGQSTSAATWNEPIVTDNVDSSLSANCSRASGSYFRVGTTAVTCSATDTAGKTGSCTFNIEVKDTEVPNVTCPDDMSQATDQGQSTSSATWNDLTVTDNVDSILSVTCSPVSGLPFSVGSTPVICSARDTAGNTGSCTFNVIVKDEDIPDVICPSDISKFTDEGQSTSLAAWHEPTVIDNVDVSLSATCSRANGSSFSVGFTTVKCSAEDTAGNTGSCSFNVEVIDIEIPTVTCPNYVSQTAVQGQSTPSATWNEPIVTDNVDSSLSANCSRASGSYFRVGTTAVTCSATDTAGNTGGCTFNVEVKAVNQITGRFTIVKIGPDIATFTADYDDPTSNAYQELALMILQALTAIFGSAPGFLDIQILNLDPGSIIVDYYVELKSTGATASDLDLLFVQNVNSEGKLNGSMLDLNPESIQKFYEICPEDYCNNGGMCSMDMNNFKSSCT
ncbi:hyalin-like [Anneissia japonica]|uniref:hyalin-like n=1 Tax=Anneissia japonica TaxID=1529436 RepID=UPI0014259F34|nr:hyalin-like [Anneissia japonica]